MDQQQEPRGQPTGRQLLWTGGLVAVLAVAVLIGYRYGITLWDWLKLLIVPVVIAGGGLWFNRQQRERELEIAERRTQDEALQAYLDQMSGMLIPGEGQPSLYRARPGDTLSSVARARTLTVLSRLDDERKAQVLQFLYEAGLISIERTVLALRGADLREADLFAATLTGAALKGVELNGAFMFLANLSGTDLSFAHLPGVNLGTAQLRRANLRMAGLYKARLGKADLSEADLLNADLSEADLRGANLSRADLRGANLSGAILSSADLSGAELFASTLTETDLSGADLHEARGVTEGQLISAMSLKGATMPNGQKYEDWLKDRERGKEDEKGE